MDCLGKVLSGVEHGGLGIGSLKAQNQALLVKWWWRFRTSNSCIWLEVIKSIYGSDGGFTNVARAVRRGNCWCNIANLPKMLVKDDLQFHDFFQIDQHGSGE